MLIKESTLRKIVREEMIKRINEKESTPTTSGSTLTSGSQFVPTEGPLDPKVIEAAKAKYVAAPKDLKIAALTIALRGIKQKFSDKDVEVSDLPGLAYALTFVPSSEPGSEFFNKVMNILKVGLDASAREKRDGQLQEALALLAAGEIAAQNKNADQYTYSGQGVLTHFIPKYQGYSTDYVSWQQSKTVGYKPANEVARVVERFAPALISAWQNLYYSMAEYSRLKLQPAGGIGYGLRPAPGGTSTPAATMEMETSSYSAPKAAAAPPRDWPSYVRAVQRGSEIQQLWNGYADRKGVSRDYSAYVTWWKSKKKANPSWKGHATDVVTSLRQEIIGTPAALDSSADLSQSFGAIQQRKAAGQ